MKERTQTGGQAISGLFTMLLFLVFVLCALFSVLMGSRVYENITKRSDENFSGTTALSYIANKIRQGDREDAVDIIEVDGTPVLQLKQKVGDEDEMFDIGFDEYVDGDGVCLIEWAELIKGIIPENAVSIKITKDLSKGLDYRKIEVEE